MEAALSNGTDREDGPAGRAPPPVEATWLRSIMADLRGGAVRRRLSSGIARRLRALNGSADALSGETTEALCNRLFVRASPGMSLACATEILRRFAAADDAGKRAFLALLAERYNADTERLTRAIERYRDDPAPERLAELHAASEPRRQQILRRLNEAPDGTAMLLAMRGALLAGDRAMPGFSALDSDFAHLFSAWFNGGFLELRRLDWSAPGAVLAKLMHYEAVHPIESWEALRARLEPADRRCYGFFHPRMGHEPLIFVEVALTAGIPARITDLLAPERAAMDPEQADTAVFYSISNCQRALRGIPFGGPLIKQVMDLLRRELPSLRRAVTLSPMPGFAAWLREQGAAGTVDAALLAALERPGWHQDAVLGQWVQTPLMRAAATYLITATGRRMDPVARFHLGNGARIEQLDWLGDLSEKGLGQSHGMMVNYLYDPARIDGNLNAFARNGTVMASEQVRRLAASPAPARLLGRMFSGGNGERER
ncbi:MAG: hypothetical protein BGP16_17260 [Sphingobium sp. 66-54]|nr:MAG: hypothetical protein BGP16_17260 [Sphingobium sp. 66-54]